MSLNKLNLDSQYNGVVSEESLVTVLPSPKQSPAKEDVS